VQHPDPILAGDMKARRRGGVEVTRGGRQHRGEVAGGRQHGGEAARWEDAVRPLNGSLRRVFFHFSLFLLFRCCVMSGSVSLVLTETEPN